jgi:homoserine dehydrogenase
MSRTIVLKLGSSILGSEDDIPEAIHEIYRWIRDGWRVVAVVSALAGETDRRIQQAARWSGASAARAALVATGEAESAALVALAADRAGIPADLFSASRLGVVAQGPDGPHLPDSSRLLRSVEAHPLVVVPGFLGLDQDGRTRLLGRGGSDLTAVVVASALGARCRLIKDVDGVFDADPALHTSARPFEQLSWEGALQVGGAIVQDRAIEAARLRGLCVEVAAIGSGGGTCIGRGVARLGTRTTPRRLTVALLGCGTVGGGVYKALTALPELFEVISVAVRRPERHPGLHPSIVHSDIQSALAAQPDVVVETLGGTHTAASALLCSLAAGRHCATANKAAVAEALPALREAARKRGVLFRSSAAVGGSVPALEEIERAASLGPIRQIEGILNGTANYVIDELASGRPLDEAIRAAQDAGFAEADPTEDLHGIDAGRKIALLAHAAFGTLPEVEHRGRIEGQVRRGHRLVARATEHGASVDLEACDDPLRSTRGEHNCLVITPEEGEPVVLRGKGAGRWPTTEALLGDLLEIHRHCTAAA